MGHRLLERAFDYFEAFGWPLASAAWLAVFGSAVAMAVVLRRRDTRGCWLKASVVGAIALGAHLLDYVVTLRITPDLAMEGNPIWRIVIDGAGVTIAKAYGLTGKILLAILSAQAFAWYLSQRHTLWPKSASGFLDFIKQLGAEAPPFANVQSFFAFSFALFGPYFFYITFMNLSGDDASLYHALPSPPVAIVGYFSAVIAGYFVVQWRAFRRSTDRSAR